MLIAESVSEKIKNGEYFWQSYQQERDCLVHFARLANTQLEDEEAALYYLVICR